jgi:hypothetical protein
VTDADFHPACDLRNELWVFGGEKLGAVIDRHIIPAPCRGASAQAAAFLQH